MATHKEVLLSNVERMVNNNIPLPTCPEDMYVKQIRNIVSKLVGNISQPQACLINELIHATYQYGIICRREVNIF